MYFIFIFHNIIWIYILGQDKHFRKIYVLGKIIFKEEKIATTEDSPYSLAPGIKYYVISVSSISSILPQTNAITSSTPPFNETISHSIQNPYVNQTKTSHNKTISSKQKHYHQSK